MPEDLESQVADYQRAQQAPLFTSPLEGAGGILAGFGAGFQGQPNPVLQQAQEGRQQELGAKLSTIKLGLELQKMREKKDEALDTILTNALKSDVLAIREWAAPQAVQRWSKKLGTPPPGLDALLVERVLSPENQKTLVKTMTGLKDEGLLSPPTIERLRQHYQIGPDTMNTYVGLLGNDRYLKSMDISTTTEIRLKNLEEQTREKRLIREDLALAHPEADKTVHQVTMDLFPGRRYYDLNTTEKQKVQKGVYDRALKLAEAQGRGRVIGAHEAEMDLPLGDKSGEWFHPTTYTTAKPQWLMGLAMAQGYVPIKDAVVRRQFGQVRQISELLEKTRDIIDARPDIWRPSTGSTTQDLINVGAAQVRFWVTGSIDPDVSAFLAHRSKIPTLTKMAGDVGNLAQWEQAIQAEAASLTHPMTREASIARLDVIRGYVNSALTQQGFSRLPPYVAKDRVPLPGGGYTLIPKGQ